MNKIDIKEIIKNTIDGDTYTKAYEVFSNKKIILKCRRNEKDEIKILSTESFCFERMRSFTVCPIFATLISINY